MKLGVRNLLVLVKIVNRGVQLPSLSICLLRQLLRLPGLGAGLQCLLVCCIGSRLRLVNTRLGPRIYILDIVCVLGGQLIKFIQPVFYRSYLAVYPLLPGKGVHFSRKSPRWTWREAGC